MDEITLSAEEATLINPLIDSNGDAYKVRQVLIALSCLMEVDPTMEEDSQQRYGTAGILRTCDAALAYMDSHCKGSKARS